MCELKSQNNRKLICKLKKIFVEAIETTLNEKDSNNKNLIDIKTHERTIVGRIAYYLQRNVYYDKFLGKNIYVDIEYNRLNGRPKKFMDKKKIIYPDLVVHNRGTDENFLVAEFKLSRDSSYDCDKIETFINDSQFRYKVGAFVNLRKFKKNKKSIKWYSPQTIND